MGRRLRDRGPRPPLPAHPDRSGQDLRVRLPLGRHLAIFASLREIYQPYNYQRTIVGFDRFSGFVSVAPEDGGFRMAHPGAFAVPVDYDRHLEAVLEEHERNSALRKARRFEIIRGDVAETLPHYLDTHPEWAGETVAIRETLDLRDLRLECFPECASPAFVLVAS